MRTSHRSNAIALTLALVGALTACGQEEPTDAAPTTPAAAPTQKAPTTADPAPTTAGGPTTENATEPTTTAPAAPGPTETETVPPTSEEPTETEEEPEPASAPYPETREDYVAALLDAWASGDQEAIDTLSSDEMAVLGHCLAGQDAGWTRYQNEGPGPHDLGWAGYPALLGAMATTPDEGQAWLYLEEASLGGPEAVIGADVNWAPGTIQLADDCFAHAVVDAVQAWADGDPALFEAMLADELKPRLDELGELGLTDGGHEVTALWAFSEHEDLPADLVVILRSPSAGPMEMPPLLVLDPAVLSSTTDGSITRVTVGTEGRRF